MSEEVTSNTLGFLEKFAPSKDSKNQLPTLTTGPKKQGAFIRADTLSRNLGAEQNTEKKESVRRKTIIKRIQPALRKAGLLVASSAGVKARLRNPLNSIPSEEVEASVRSAIKTKKFFVHLVQLGSEYRLGFTNQFLNIMSQMESEIGLFLIKGSPKSKMNKIEEQELSGRMDKSTAAVIFVGNFPKTSALDRDLVNGDSGTQLVKDDTGLSDHFFENFCFQLPEAFPNLTKSILDWKGLALVKRADTHPITSYPVVLWMATLGPPEQFEEKIAEEKTAKARQQAINEEEAMTSSTTWSPGLGLKNIRKFLKPKLRYFDKDGSGIIEFEEFKAVTENLGIFVTEARLQRLFAACDLDRSGTVELEELPLAIHINDNLKPRARLSPKDAFELFDYDGSGELNEHEFFEALQTITPKKLSREEATKVFYANDKDNSGLIEYEEFRKIWFSLCDVQLELHLRYKEWESTKKEQPDKELVAARDKEWKPYNKLFTVAKSGEWSGSRLRRATSFLEVLVREEEEYEEEEFNRVCERCYQDMRTLRLESDVKKKEQNKVRKREALAARVATSKAERELRRQKKVEENQRKQLEDRERVLRKQLDKELRYREEKERARKKAEREFKLKQEKEARAKRGDDRLEMPERALRLVPEECYKSREAQEKLSYIVNMDFSWNKIDRLPENRFLIWCGSLRRLILSHNKLSTLPNELDSLEGLQLLNLLNNHIRYLPKEVGGLKSLVSLNIAENQLEKICPEIGRLKVNLSEIVAYRNALEVIPAELGSCENLRCLDLSLNKLRDLPEELGNLKNLQHLDLSWNRIQKFPKALGYLSNLETLELSSNELRRLPDTLDGLHSLKILNCGRNDLAEIPPSIKGLVSILKIDAGRNRIVRLPSEIGDLRTLQFLSISGNKVRTFPREIAKLQSLGTLDARGNQINILPDEIGALSSLQSLNLSENKLSGRLPGSIGSLRLLVRLDMSHNQIEVLPASIGALVSLRYFDLTNNLLQEVPETIGLLRALEVLRLARNKLSNVPHSFKTIYSLRELDLASNILEWLPVEISELDKLERLDLQHNRLKAVPAEFGKLLPQLAFFSVTHNPLSEFPKRFGSDVRCKDASQLLWSGYSDGQVGEYLIEVNEVYRACKELIDFDRLFGTQDSQEEEVETANQEGQTLREFEDIVKGKMVAAGVWREHLVKHVHFFYFKAKALGSLPRLEALYGVEEKAHTDRVELHQKRRDERLAKVKDEWDIKQMQLEECYNVPKQKLIYTEAKLDERKEDLRRERRDKFIAEIGESARACYFRQESVYQRVQEQRENEKHIQLSSYLSHFSAERSKFISDLRSRYPSSEEAFAASFAELF